MNLCIAVPGAIAERDDKLVRRRYEQKLGYSPIKQLLAQIRVSRGLNDRR